MWGIIPAAGRGSRIQPLAFSKELLPVGSSIEGGSERPRAVSEYLVERMIRGGADKLCFVISPWKSDIVQYFGEEFGPARISYVVQSRPSGLCAAVFQPLPFIQPDEQVLVGLPDTVWFPENAFRSAPDDRLSFLLFPVERPELFDAVLVDQNHRVQEIRVKNAEAGTNWIWGAFKLSGAVLRSLHDLWMERNGQDEYFGTLVNAWLARGGSAWGIPSGEDYVDVGTLHGYREAIHLLQKRYEVSKWVTTARGASGNRLELSHLCVPTVPAD